MYIDAMMRLTQGNDWLTAVAEVGVASKYPIPTYYLLLRGLRNTQGLMTVI